MAATLAQGTTIIESAACEPEIENLCHFLKAMGAKIEGTGSYRLIVTGVKKLKGVSFDVIPDRIEAGTYILLAAATRGDILVKGADYAHLWALMDKLKQAGVDVTREKTRSGSKQKDTAAGGDHDSSVSGIPDGLAGPIYGVNGRHTGSECYYRADLSGSFHPCRRVKPYGRRYPARRDQRDRAGG